MALYCVFLYNQSALQSCGLGGVGWGGGGAATATATGQRHQYAHHTSATGGEEREPWSQSRGWGLLVGHD